MTEIRYRQRGDVIRVSVTGHALYNPGNDPVCGGVSAITYQMLNVLADNALHISDFAYEVRDGSVIVSFFLPEEWRETWAIIWSTIKTGYEALATAYPENVKVV